MPSTVEVLLSPPVATSPNAVILTAPKATHDTPTPGTVKVLSSPPTQSSTPDIVILSAPKATPDTPTPDTVKIFSSRSLDAPNTLPLSLAKQNKTQPDASDASAQSTAPSVALAHDGQAMPIVISADADGRQKALAQTLADYLHQISGAPFKVQTGAKVLSAKTPGIVVGISSQIPDLDKLFDLKDPTRSEDYVLRSHSGGVLLVGASDLAVEHAVWDFLYRLGYRQFFPGKDWEIIPHQHNLSVAIDTFQHPDYYARSIWPDYSMLKENSASSLEWMARNRLGQGIQLSTGEAYGRIINDYKAVFDKHPEYLTRPGGNQFCVSNPGLQQLVIYDALSKFQKDPRLQSVSLEPSDNIFWKSDSCPDDKIFKSITDRVVTLANIVAQAVNKEYPGKFVGIYAYNDHSEPPNIDVDPHVIPSVATKLIRGGYSVDEILKAWHQKAQTLGIRDYYSIDFWTYYLPGKPRASDLQYITTSIPHYYNEGARFMNAEGGDDFGPDGLGYYIATRLLWNTKDAANVDAIKADFFDKAFGPAKEPMEKYYQLIDGSNKPLISDDLIGRMYRQLSEALKLTNDTAIQKRINDLVLYTHYVELYRNYSQAEGAARQATFETLMRYTWRIRTTHMVHTVALWLDLAARDKSVKFPEGTDYSVPDDKNLWKSSQPFTNADLQQMIDDGIANNKLKGFTPVSFSHDLVPATPLHLTTGKEGAISILRGSQDFYTWITKAPTTIDLQFKAGQLFSFPGKARISLYPATTGKGVSVVPQPLASQDFPEEEQFQDVHLKSTVAGLNRININDKMSGSQIRWTSGMPMTMESSLDAPTHFEGQWTLFFYVPKGTKIIGGYHNTQFGSIKSPDGKTALTFTRKDNPGYWSIPVPAGQDGKLWQISKIWGEVNLMTVPPYLARSADELLLPREVVQTDAGK
jgi:hypothetical protein